MSRSHQALRGSSISCFPPAPSSNCSLTVSLTPLLWVVTCLCWLHNVHFTVLCVNCSVKNTTLCSHFLHYTDPVLASESCFSCTVRPGAGLPGWRLSAGCTFRMETSAVRRVTRLPCATSEQHLRWPFLRCRRPAHMERAHVQPTWHLGYHWLLSTNIWKHTCSPSHFETTAHLWHLWFICAVYKFTYLHTVFQK